MGVSTDGILVFGFEVGEEDERPDFLEGVEDFDEYVDRESGLPEWGEHGHSFEDQRAFRDKYPVDLITHCSYDYPMHILAVRGTKRRASRGYPLEIDPTDLNVPSEKLEAFKNWAAERGIQGEPKWLLCSLWG